MKAFIAIAIGGFTLAAPAQFIVHPVVVQWPAQGAGTTLSAHRAIQLNTAIMVDAASGRTWILSPAGADDSPPLVWLQIPHIKPTQTNHLSLTTGQSRPGPYDDLPDATNAVPKLDLQPVAKP